jgi:hypothetical protein
MLALLACPSPGFPALFEKLKALDKYHSGDFIDPEMFETLLADAKRLARA